ncbi:MAG TPA: citrate synthase/methylcitrate synthase [Bacillales bacterium]|nr:citrate synthase/methylcitrate synthase [Bacillales bacterium]
MDYRAGLEGVVAAKTALSLIDGEKGELLFRGEPAGELAKSKSFEEAAYFLWNGSFANPEQLASFKHQLAAYRELPVYLVNILDQLPDEMEMMEVLRTAVSALGVQGEWPPQVNEAMLLTAVVPTILAYRYRNLRGEVFIHPRKDLDQAANYLYMLKGEEPNQAHVRALNAYFVLTMEHGLNASTFSARVVASTESDLFSAISGAIGTMKGPLHGGAPTGVISMLGEIGEIENAEPYLRSVLEEGGRLMGFGHRVYKTKDPRAVALKAITKELAGEDPWLDLANFVEDKAIELLEEYKPGRRLYTNVEFYAAAILRAVEMPKELYTPTFTSSRVAGWAAHVMEQAANNRIFRPKAEYIGVRP